MISWRRPSDRDPPSEDAAALENASREDDASGFGCELAALGYGEYRRPCDEGSREVLAVGLDGEDGAYDGRLYGMCSCTGEPRDCVPAAASVRRRGWYVNGESAAGCAAPSLTASVCAAEGATFQS